LKYSTDEEIYLNSNLITKVGHAYGEEAQHNTVFNDSIFSLFLSLLH